MRRRRAFKVRIYMSIDSIRYGNHELEIIRLGDRFSNM